MPSIVQLIVQQQIAPAPNNLQRMGALVSQGGSILMPGASSYLTQLSDLTPLLRPASNNATLTWAAGTVTVTTTLPHGVVNAHFMISITGAVPTGYNGTYFATVTGASTFTYPLAINPGANTAPGFWNTAFVTELIQMATTWFAQGVRIGAYVLEMGIGTAVDGINALTAYLTANPNTSFTAGAQGYFYAYLVPRGFDQSIYSPAANAAFRALAATLESTTAKTYFFVTTTLSNYPLYPAAMKSVFWEIEAPSMAVYPSTALVSLTQVGGTVTGSTATAHGVSPGNWFQLQGNTPAGYNGWWQAQTGSAGQVLVFNNPLTSPGAVTSLGFLVASQATGTGIAANEFTAAASMYDIVSNNPSSTNKVPPTAYQFQFGVTPWPTPGMAPTTLAILNAGGNYVGTGAEGGISTATLFYGQTADGNDFLYWYAVDAAELYGDENLSNVVINGSNNDINPLYYSQNGINRLQESVYNTMVTLASWGLLNGTQIVNTQFPGSSQPGSNVQSLTEALDSGVYAGMIVVNAEPYLAYLTENPNDYQAKRYAGLSAIIIPSTGFRQIVLNYLVTQLITQ